MTIEQFFIKLFIFIIIAFMFNLTSDILSVYWPKKLETKVDKTIRKNLYYISEALLIITIAVMAIFLFANIRTLCGV